MRVNILLLTLACLLIGTASFAGDDTYTLYLVRHAEKQADGSRDPALTKAGQQRAVYLATWLTDKRIEDIWSSDYRRTRDTARPLAIQLGIETSTYDPGNQPLLTGHLLGKQNTALVVGHSNTIPELARMLCECEIADMEETEYDRLIVISIDGGQARAETRHQTELF